jgi:hypothetical protein
MARGRLWPGISKEAWYRIIVSAATPGAVGVARADSFRSGPELRRRGGGARSPSMLSITMTIAATASSIAATPASIRDRSSSLSDGARRTERASR